MTPKRLDPEELALRIGRLRRSLASFGTEFAGLLDQSLHEIRAHIAALEQQLEASMSPPSALVVLQIVKAERDAALADNAKFQKALDEAAGLLEDACSEGLNAHFARRVMKDAAEFIALLETDHPGSTLLEEHRKALVRPRNEGLEEIASQLDAHGDWKLDISGTRLAKNVRSMKEPESD